MGQHGQRPGALGVIEEAGNLAITPLHEIEEFHVALALTEGDVVHDALDFAERSAAEALERERVYTP
jgi:hypothetical protein